MQETKEQKTCILVGHFHHKAACECGATTTVESYYEQLPPIVCPSCKKVNQIETEKQDELFVSAALFKCEKCSCLFTTAPEPLCPACPTCGEYLWQEATDPTPNETNESRE